MKQATRRTEVKNTKSKKVVRDLCMALAGGLVITSPFIAFLTGAI